MKKFNLVKGIAVMAAVVLVAGFSSCQKDSTDEPTSVSKTGLLTSGAWVVSSMEVVLPTGTMDLIPFMDACDLDDKTTFKSDKSILLDAGATKCDPSEPQTSNGGTWAFASNETELVYTDPIDGPTTYKINTLSSSALAIQYTEFDSTFMSDVTVKVGFKH